MSERDPLELLQAAWQSQPEVEPTPSLDDAEPLTQQTVAWIRDAWQQMEIPAAALPQRKRKRILQWRTWYLPVATAAALLISALIFLNSQDANQENLEPSHVSVNGVEPTLPAVPEAPLDPPTTPPSAPKTPPAPATPRLLAATPERVEVLSGRVRLTMLAGPGPSSETQSTDS